MADKIFTATEADKRVLQDLIARERGRLNNVGGRGHYAEEDSQAPEVYIARTPYGPNGDGVGIPGLVRAGDDELRIRDRDQAYVFFNGEDQPGKALCDIYRIIRAEDPARDVLRVMPGLAQWVWNLSTEPVPENEWIPVQRDKSGAWVYKQPPIPVVEPPPPGDTVPFSGARLRPMYIEFAAQFGNGILQWTADFQTALFLENAGDTWINLAAGNGEYAASFSLLLYLLPGGYVAGEGGFGFRLDDADFVNVRGIFDWPAPSAPGGNEGGWTLASALALSPGELGSPVRFNCQNTTRGIWALEPRWSYLNIYRVGPRRIP